MFSREYLTKLSEKTGFRPEGLQKQMTLLDLLREFSRHPMLREQYAIKGGTAINLFWFSLPRLSVDMDLNYIGSADRDEMLEQRPKLEEEIRKIVLSKSITIERAPTDHAGAKWRLRAPSAFGGNFTLELDLNYLLRIPLWGVESRKSYLLDEDFAFEGNSVSSEELFAGKIKALLERSAARDLYDVHKFIELKIEHDPKKLRTALVLLGITCNDDWREKDLTSIDGIDDRMINDQLRPLLRGSEDNDLEKMKKAVKQLLSSLMRYAKNERLFMDRFLTEGIYQPELLFEDRGRSDLLRQHPAVLWKLQNHRVFLGLDKKVR
jgi:predicted nucleotidyltransferase component of viral defense system